MQDLSNKLMHIASKPKPPDIWTERTSGYNISYNKHFVWTGLYYILQDQFLSTTRTGLNNLCPIAYTSTNFSTWTERTITYTSTTPSYFYGPMLTNGSGTVITCGRQNVACIAYSIDHGETWTLKTNMAPSNQTYTSGAYSPTLNRFVITTSDYLSYSSDGINWTHISQPMSGVSSYNYNYNSSDNQLYWDPNSSLFYHVTSNAGIFYYSSDGINWTSATYTIGGSTPASATRWIRRIGSYYVISTGWNVAYSSTIDGNYTSVSLTAPSVTESPRLDVAISTTTKLFATGTTGIYIYTSDGVNWTQISTSITNSSMSYSDQYNRKNILWGTAGSDGIYLVSNAAGIYKSIDGGANWTSIGSYGTFQEVVYNSYSNRWIATKVPGGIFTSTNGLTWTQVINPTSTGSFSNIVLANGGQNILIAQAEATPYYFSSDGGINWSTYTLPSTAGLTVASGIIRHYSVYAYWTGTYYVIFGTNGTGNFSPLLYSSTGTGSWTSIAPSGLPQYLYSTGANSAGTIIATSGTGNISSVRTASTNNGLTWNLCGLDNSAKSIWPGGTRRLSKIAYSPSLARTVLVGDSGTTKAGYFYSNNDGQTWTIQSSNINRTLQSLTWNSALNKFQAVYLGYYIQSTDGITWTETATGSSQYCLQLESNALDGDGNTLIGSGFSNLNKSIDGGSTWTFPTFGNSGISIRYIGANIWLHADELSNNTIYIRRSTDNGANWTGVYSSSGYSNRWLYYHGPKPAFNNSGTIVYIVSNYTTTNRDLYALTSTNYGANWTLYSLPQCYLSGIIFWNGTQFIGYSSNGKTFTSTNGTTWSITNTPPAYYFNPDVPDVYATSTLCLVGPFAKAKSTNGGSTWTVYDNGVLYADIIWSSSLNKFVAIGANGKNGIFTTDNPTGDANWVCESIIQDPVYFETIKYNPYKATYYAVGATFGNRPVIYQSSNLVDWTLKHEGSGSPLRTIGGSTNRAVAAGSNHFSLTNDY